MELKGKKINFLGDSITQGVGVSEEQNIYLNVMKRECGLAEARNYGISGTRLAHQQGEDDTERAYTLRYPLMDDDADVIVIFGGTNDYGHGNAPMGSFEDRTPDTYYGACHYLLTGLMEKYPKAQLVFMTPIHREDEANPSFGNGLPLKVYSNVIKEVCEYYAVPVLDLFAVSGIQPCCQLLKERYCPDGLHPNDAGHALIASRLTGFLKAL